MRQIKVIVVVFFFLGAISALYAAQDVRLSSDSKSFKLYLQDLNKEAPFISIERLPRAKNFTLTHKRGAVRNSFQPFIFKLDIDFDSNPEILISPETTTSDFKTNEAVNIGCQSNGFRPFSDKIRMPEFERILLVLADTLDELSPYRNRSFKLNRVIIRRQRDGNIQITLRDKFFRSGKDKVYITNFTWK
jgi:hypothetical protein